MLVCCLLSNHRSPYQVTISFVNWSFKKCFHAALISIKRERQTTQGYDMQLVYASLMVHFFRFFITPFQLFKQVKNLIIFFQFPISLAKNGGLFRLACVEKLMRILFKS